MSQFQRLHNNLLAHLTNILSKTEIVLTGDESESLNEEQIEDIKSVAQSTRELQTMLHEHFDDPAKYESEAFPRLAHALRTPINSITGFSSIVAAGLDGEVSEAQAKTLLEINEIGEIILEYLDQLAEWLRYRNGAIRINRKPVLIHAILEAGRLAHAAEIQFILESADQSLKVNADKHYFTRMLGRLIKHSIVQRQATKFHAIVEVREAFLQVTLKDDGLKVPTGEEEQSLTALYQFREAPAIVVTDLERVLAHELIALHLGSLVADADKLIFKLPMAE